MIKRIFKNVFFSVMPGHVILHVTNRCNLRCRSCFVDFSGRKNSVELTLAEIKQLAARLGSIVWLDISGGEPFLREDLPDICAAFDAGAVSIPTNGLDPDRVHDMTVQTRRKTGAELSVALSLDGFEETNDSIRGDGCFKQAVETLLLLKAVKGIRVKINTVLCEKNYDELIDFMRFIKKFNVDFHSVIFLRGMPRDPECRLPSYEKLQAIKADIFDMWDGYAYGAGILAGRLLRSYQRRMYEASLKVIREQRQAPKCLAGSRHLVIYANGDAAFCEMLEPFGNLGNGGLATLLKSQGACVQRDSISAGKCFCHHNCNMLDNFLLQPLQYPRLLGGVCRC